MTSPLILIDLGVAGMTCDDCVDHVTKALESVALGLLDDHLKHCVMDAAAEGGPVAEAKLKEASDAIARLVRS